MEGCSSKISHYRYRHSSTIQYGNTTLDPRDQDWFSETSSDEENKTSVSADTILPDDLLEKILAYLPIASIFRAGSVCKRWHEIVSSKRFLWSSCQDHLSQKPWYFMFTGGSDDAFGYTYDPTLRKWYCIDLPDFITSQWFIASSCGLVCFMDHDTGCQLHVCNPITKNCKRLIEPPPDMQYSDYIALAISVSSSGVSSQQRYSISIVKSKQVPDNFYQWNLSIHLYDSETMLWVTSRSEVLNGWRAGDASVICGGVLYFLIYAAGGGPPQPDNTRHRLIRYNLSNIYHRRSSHCLLMRDFIPAPCALTCGRLMNLREKLVMVGGIGKQDRSDVIKGIGVWVLNESEWQEVGRMPHKFFQGFGELDDVFASSGTDDLIYIQSYGAPALLVFDMGNRQWKWSLKCPVTKRFPLQMFTGFCFEARLEITP